MLSLQTEVLEAYLRAVDDREAWRVRNSSLIRRSAVEYDGTITAANLSDPRERRVVARWSVDLAGKIRIRLVNASRSRC